MLSVSLLRSLQGHSQLFCFLFLIIRTLEFLLIRSIHGLTFFYLLPSCTFSWLTSYSQLSILARVLTWFALSYSQRYLYSPWISVFYLQCFEALNPLNGFLLSYHTLPLLHLLSIFFKPLSLTHSCPHTGNMHLLCLVSLALDLFL